MILPKSRSSEELLPLWCRHYKRFVAMRHTIFKVFQCDSASVSNQLLMLVRKLIRKKDRGDVWTKEASLHRRTKNSWKSTALIDTVEEIERMANMVQENLERPEMLCFTMKWKAVSSFVRERVMSILSMHYGVPGGYNKYQLPLADAARIGGLFHVVIDIERIGDHAVNILEAAEKKRDSRIRFTEEARDEMIDIYAYVTDIYGAAIKMFTTEDASLLEEIDYLENISTTSRLNTRKLCALSMGRCSI